MLKFLLNLRTVRVTAAVYQGLYSKREPLLLTYWHWAGVRPYTSSYDLAESCVFIKQSQPSDMLRRDKRGTPSPEVTESICRVPSIWLYHDLSMLYLFTCVGLGYGA